MRPTESRLGEGTGRRQGRAGDTGASCHFGPSAMALLIRHWAQTADPLTCLELITRPEMVPVLLTKGKQASRGQSWGAGQVPHCLAVHPCPALRKRAPSRPRSPVVPVCLSCPSL